MVKFLGGGFLVEEVHLVVLINEGGDEFFPFVQSILQFLDIPTIFILRPDGLLILESYLLVYIQHFVVVRLYSLHFLSDGGELELVLCVGLLELTVLSEDLLGLFADDLHLALYLLAFVDFVLDVLPAALKVVDGLVQLLLRLLFLFLELVDLALEELVVLKRVLQLLPGLPQSLEQQVLLLLEGLDDLIQLFIIGLGEEENDVADGLDGLLPDEIGNVFLVVPLVEEEVFEFIEDGECAFLIR